MSDQPNERRRRRLRLKGYDYSEPGAYFVTVCACNRECLFGEIDNGLMRLNAYGQAVASEWARSAEVRSEIECGEFVIMPNHFHGIVRILVGAYGNTPFPHDHAGVRHAGGPYGAYCHTPLRSPSRNVGAMVRGFKASATRRINEMRNTPGMPVWQRNYYEHIIRNDADYSRIAEYIANNPRRWMEDTLHPDNP